MRSTAVSVLFALAISLVSIAAAGDVAAQGARHTPQTRPSARVSAPPRAVRYPPVGHSIRTLPEKHQIVRVHRHSYRYYDGVFYRPSPQGLFVVVQAPIGARVRHLPAGYISFLIGPRRYFYVNYTYYLWDRDATEYIVVSEPAGAETAVVAASESVSGQIFVYPNRGQSDEQRDRDRYECYVWAVEQTGFDPAAEDREPDEAGDYRRAMSACLEGRGYTVK